MHFAIHAFSSHVEVLNKVTPIDLLAQSAVLFSLTGWLCGICTIYSFIRFMETKTKWRKRLQLCKNSIFPTVPRIGTIIAFSLCNFSMVHRLDWYNAD